MSYLISKSPYSFTSFNHINIFSLVKNPIAQMWKTQKKNYGKGPDADASARHFFKRKGTFSDEKAPSFRSRQGQYQRPPFRQRVGPRHARLGLRYTRPGLRVAPVPLRAFDLRSSLWCSKSVGSEECHSSSHQGILGKKPDLSGRLRGRKKIAWQG